MTPKVKRQVASGRWPMAAAVINVSQYQLRKCGEWKLAYEYSVGGPSYRGHANAPDSMPIQGPTDVLRHVAAYPAGAAVVVAYDPDNAADAYLRAGLRGATVWVAMFLTPLAIVGLGMRVGLFKRWEGLQRFDPLDTRQVCVTASGTFTCRPLATRRAATFLNYLAVVTLFVAWLWLFVGVALGVGYRLTNGSVLDPPTAAPASVWVAVLVGCAVATRAAGTAPFLTVDQSAELLLVACGRQPPIAFPFATIDAVKVSEKVQGRKRSTFATYLVEVMPRGGEAAVSLAEYYDSGNANALADWLRWHLAHGPLVTSEEENRREAE
jgi:hypothetical protein